MKTRRLAAMTALIGIGLAAFGIGLAAHAALAQQPGISRAELHAAKNLGSGHTAELATYVVEKGKPLFTAARMGI